MKEVKQKNFYWLFLMSIVSLFLWGCENTKFLQTATTTTKIDLPPNTTVTRIIAPKNPLPVCQTTCKELGIENAIAKIGAPNKNNSVLGTYLCYCSKSQDPQKNIAPSLPPTEITGKINKPLPNTSFEIMLTGSNGTSGIFLCSPK